MNNHHFFGGKVFFYQCASVKKVDGSVISQMYKQLCSHRGLHIKMIATILLDGPCYGKKCLGAADVVTLHEQ